MHHIVLEPSGGWNLDDYFAYLDMVRSRMPAAVHAFAAHVGHYDFSSRESLHDARLETLTVRESPAAADPRVRKIDIETCYLGPFHDCRTFLTYRCVASFNLDTPTPGDGPAAVRTGHGDLAMHEMRLTDDGLSEHELVFDRGSVFVIRFEALEHRIEPVNAVPGQE